MLHHFCAIGLFGVRIIGGTTREEAGAQKANILCMHDDLTRQHPLIRRGLSPAMHSRVVHSLNSASHPSPRLNSQCSGTFQITQIRT